MNPAPSSGIRRNRSCTSAASISLQAVAVHAVPLQLTPGLRGETVLQRASHACLDHLLRNEQAGRAGDAEGIHQMRVAMRRLRAVLSTFAPLLPPEPRRWASEELRWLADVLSEARDLDVFASSLLTPARAGLPASSEFERLAEAIERRRRSAHADANVAISSPRYAASVQALKNWVDGCAWSANGNVEDLRQPIGEIAPKLLEPCRRRAKKRCKGFSDQTDEERHQLRIALKKLRYAAEVLGSLYDPAKTSQFNQRVKRLQDDLGYINDVRVGRDIVANLADGEIRPASATPGAECWRGTSVALPTTNRS